jgi:MarR family transcriptional regulator, negative regulator of the multidrug operon emrRAB
MKNSANVLGALALAIAGVQSEAVEKTSGLSGSGPAAIVLIGIDPGMTIGALAQVVGVAHSVAVRLVDTLVKKGLGDKIIR